VKSDPGMHVQRFENNSGTLKKVIEKHLLEGFCVGIVKMAFATSGKETPGRRIDTPFS
jgi:hypothetical protein